jgi:threonine/homoserine/homoserine lactone efflux protein
MWQAFVFGAVVAGAIGPIALLIFGTAARHGFAAGAVAGLGAALADFLYALAAFSIGALLLPMLDAHADALRAGCALILVGLGAAMLAGLRKRGRSPEPARPAAHAFLPTFLLTIVNPMTLVMFAGLAPQLPVAGSLATAAGLALALAAGSFAVAAAVAGFGAVLGRALPAEGARRAVTAASALGILAFGVYGVVSAF